MEVTLLLPQNRYSERAPTATVDKDGRFRMEDVPLGRYVVFGKSPTHYMAALAADNNQISWGPDGPIGGALPPLVVVSKDGETVSRDLEMKVGPRLPGQGHGAGRRAGGRREDHRARLRDRAAELDVGRLVPGEQRVARDDRRGGRLPT